MQVDRINSNEAFEGRVSENDLRNKKAEHHPCVGEYYT